MTPLVTRAECCSREQVPPFWGQDERQAVMDAAELAGLKVLSLMNENTAGAPSSALPGRLHHRAALSRVAGHSCDEVRDRPQVREH